MQLIFWFLISTGLLIGILLTLNYIINPSGKPLSNFKYPYALSLKPPLISTGDSVEISVSSSNRTTNLTNTKILVIDPRANVFAYNKSIQTNYQTLKFPYNFTSLTLPNAKPETNEGNYSVLLASTIKNQSLINLSFNVVYNSNFYSLGNFAFQSGFPITIGLVITAITTVYQYLSSRNADRNRQLQDKAKWIIDNSKYYMDLFYWSSHICSCFDVDSVNGKWIHKKIDIFHLLFCMSRFHKSYDKFVDNTGMYYFDDVLSEDFLNKVEQMIFNLYKDIMDNDFSHLKKFLKEEEYNLRRDKDFERYRQKLDCWLSDDKPITKLDNQELERGDNPQITKANLFYFSHVVYGWVLNASVNDGSLVTYRFPSRVQRSMHYEVQRHKELLEEGITYLNNIFYGKNKKRHYQLRVKNKQLLKESIKENRRIEIILWIMVSIIAVIATSVFFQYLYMLPHSHYLSIFSSNILNLFLQFI